MALKLFRTGPNARSSMFNDAHQPAGTLPASMVIGAGLWLAIAGNLALWRAVERGTDGGGLVMVIAMGAGIAAFNCALLSLLAWRELLKAAVTVLFLLAACGTWMLLADTAGPANVQPWTLWQRVLAVLLVAIVPMLWVWSRPLQPISGGRQAGVNLLILVVSLAVLAGVMAVAGHNLQSLVHYEPGWACMINPAAPLLKAAGQCATIAGS